MLCVSYLIEDAPKTVDASPMSYALNKYFFVDYFMTRIPWISYDMVKQEVNKYKMVWQNNDAESLSKQFMCCSQYINTNFGVVTHPDSRSPAIYTWDFVNLFSPYIKEIETGKKKEEGMNYPS